MRDDGAVQLSDPKILLIKLAYLLRLSLACFYYFPFRSLRFGLVVGPQPNKSLIAQTLHGRLSAMRLLNTDTLELETFVGAQVPQYAILSHTWGEEEILYEDVLHGKAHFLGCKKTGLVKVRDSCARALQQSFQYIWIDTCCIDKSSSAELSEAINSMFKWYEGSGACYAYLADFEVANNNGEVATETLKGCRWFTRGWTLQELLAPQKVEFYDKNWTLFGDRTSLAKRISGITGIDERALTRHSSPGCVFDPEARFECMRCSSSLVIREILNSFSVATRMFWASQRQTTRREDIAYSLLGIFDVNMPLLYGEDDRAFHRLQLEIAKVSEDHSILAWDDQRWTIDRPPGIVPISTFASSPSKFTRPFVSTWHQSRTSKITLKDAGLELEVLLGNCTIGKKRLQFAALDCSTPGDSSKSAALVLQGPDSGAGHGYFSRIVVRPIIKKTETLPTCALFCVEPVAEPIGIAYGDYKVHFNMANLKKKKILLKTKPDTYRPKGILLRIPLIVQPREYRLRHAFPAYHGESVSLSRGPPRCSHGFQALCFTDGHSDGFFIFWGIMHHFHIPNEVWDIKQAASFCSVRSWASVMGHDYCKEDEAAMMFDESWFSRTMLQVLRDPKSLDIIMPDKGLPIPVTVSRPSFRASIGLIESLGRFALQLKLTALT